MEKLKELCKVQFDKKDIKQMKTIDGVFALLYYLFYIALIFCFGLIMYRTDVYVDFSKYFKNMSFFKFIFYIPITIISILPAFLIIYFRGQKMSSLGLRKTKVMKSIFLGIFFGLPVILPNIIIGIINSYNFKSMELLVWDFLFYLICIGLVEELIFRGFIQIRLRGIINSKWLSIVVVGVMFGAMHIPFQMLKSNLSLIEFIQSDLPHLLMTLVIHIYFVYIYTRDNNIIAPIITHAIFNFSNNLFFYN